MAILKLSDTQACYLYNMLAEQLKKDISLSTKEIRMDEVKKKLSKIVWG